MKPYLYLLLISGVAFSLSTGAGGSPAAMLLVLAAWLFLITRSIHLNQQGRRLGALGFAGAAATWTILGILYAAVGSAVLFLATLIYAGVVVLKWRGVARRGPHDMRPENGRN